MNKKNIDGLSVDNNGEFLRLRFIDPFQWKEMGNPLMEDDHLKILEHKIGEYIEFIEKEEYKQIYPDSNFSLFIIEMHFEYNYSVNCARYLEMMQMKLREMGVVFERHFG